MRGERMLSERGANYGDGSSPHARGTPEAEKLKESASRFIPACAGNAWAAFKRVNTLAVHPRMRGERSIERKTLH